MDVCFSWLQVEAQHASIICLSLIRMGSIRKGWIDSIAGDRVLSESATIIHPGLKENYLLHSCLLCI